MCVGWLVRSLPMHQLALAILVVSCGAASMSPPEPAAAGGWEVYQQRDSGGPPFAENRILIRSTGDVTSVELCQDAQDPCALRMPGTFAGNEPECNHGKHPVLRAHARTDQLAVL